MKLKVVTVPYKENGFYMLLAIPKSKDEHIGEPLLLLIQMKFVISYSRHLGSCFRSS